MLWIKDLHWSFRRECCKRTLARERTVLWQSNCISLLIAQFLPLTQRFCVAMGKWFQPTFHFPQHCFQAPNVRQRGWWHSVFRGWLTAVSGRCRWVSSSSKTWNSSITLSYELFFWLFRETCIILLHLLFPGGKKRCYYLDFCLSSPVVKWKNTVFPSGLFSALRSNSCLLQIVNISDCVWVQQGFNLSLSHEKIPSSIMKMIYFSFLVSVITTDFI